LLALGAHHILYVGRIRVKLCQHRKVVHSITLHLVAGAPRDDYFGENMQRGWAREVISVTNDSGEGQRGPVRDS